MSTLRGRTIEALAIASGTWLTACLPALPVGMIAAAAARNPGPLPVVVTVDSIRSNERLRVWTLNGERPDFVNARFDSLTAATVHFTKTRDARPDSAVPTGAIRLDVIRGTWQNPTRAFWMPFVGSAAGLVAVAAGCGVSGAQSEGCVLGATLFGALPGLAVGTWYGLRHEPRWVTVKPR